MKEKISRIIKEITKIQDDTTDETTSLQLGCIKDELRILLRENSNEENLNKSKN